MEKKPTRREFLKKSTLLAAAPYVIPSTVLGRDGAVAANSRLTTGHIGIGGMGGGHFGACLGNPAVQILAVCDVDGNKLEACRTRVEDKYAADRAAGTYKGCFATKDFREVAARDDIDAVVIATPDHWHALTAIACAEAGKDIYCEKPMSLTVREARAMVNAVRRYGRVFQTGSQQRSSREFRKACELVRNGRIGKILDIYVNVGGPSGEIILPEEPVPAGFDWERWLGPAPWRPFNHGYHPAAWRGYRDFSGGSMTDWGAHHFDIAQWGLGMDESGPVEVHPPDTGEYPSLTFIYANGVRVHHYWARDGKALKEYTLPPGKTGVNGVLFVGENGWVEVNRGYFQCFPAAIEREPLGPNDVHLYASRGHMQDWMDCIKTRKRPICDVEIGCRSVSVCHIGNIAYWLRRSLKWDPAKEEFVGDEEANRWLDRAKREPWSL